MDKLEAKEVLSRSIGQRVESAKKVVELIESTVITDKLVATKALGFNPAGILDEIIGDKKVDTGIRLGVGEEWESLHPHAFSQVASRAGVPVAYAKYLLDLGSYGAELLSHNYRVLYGQQAKRVLVRSVGTEVRGFLSEHYKRFDTRRLLDAFLGRCQSLGLEPSGGLASDTRVTVRAILPVVFEPVEGEPYAFGAEWGTSDYGAGAYYLSMFLMRLQCLNGMTMDRIVSQAHLGGKIASDAQLSDETIEHDTRAIIGKTQDIMGHAFDPQKLERISNHLQKAYTEDGENSRKKLAKTVSKEEFNSIMSHYEGPDVVNMPQGHTKARLANAVSWFSQSQAVSPERQAELESLAGDLLGPVGIETTEV